MRFLSIKHVPSRLSIFRTLSSNSISTHPACSTLSGPLRSCAEVDVDGERQGGQTPTDWARQAARAGGRSMPSLV